jgi:hypothetical protein
VNPSPSLVPHPAAGTTNLLAILSLPAAVLVAPIGLVLAHLARVELPRTGERGRGLTTAALVLGYAFCGLWALFWMAIFVSAAAEEISWLRAG